MRIPGLDGKVLLDPETFAREFEKQVIADSEGALIPGYEPTGHTIPRSSKQHLEEYVGLRSAHESLLQRDRLARAAVLDIESAWTLLTHLHSKGVIKHTGLYELGLSKIDVPIAVGVLAQANLINVDPWAVRISTDGVKYMQYLLQPSK